jgi:tetratricopeptide (TPR) repeat protein
MLVKALFRHTILLCLLALGVFPAPVSGLQSSSGKGTKLEELAQQAEEAQNRSDYESAARIYQQILDLSPDLTEVRANLGLMYHLMGRYGEAVKTFEIALRRQPQLFVPNLFQGLDLLRLQQAERALPYLERAHRSQPRDEQAILGLAQAYVALADFEKGDAWYQRLAAINSRNAEAWYGMGITYLRLQQSAIEQLGKRDLDSVYFRALLAESIVQQGRLDDAVKLYGELLKAYPSQPCLHSALGFAEVRKGDLSTAAREFQKDLQVSPVCLEAWLGQARIAIEQNRIPDALKEIDHAWYTDPESVKANAPLVWIGMNLEQLDGVEEKLKYTRAIPETPAVAALITGMARWHKEPVEVFERDSESEGGAGSSESAPAEKGLRSKAAGWRYAQGRYSQCAQSLGPRFRGLRPAELVLLAQCSYLSGDDRTAFLASGRLIQTSPENLAGWFWRAKSTRRLVVAALVRAAELEPGSYRFHLLLAEVHKDQHDVRKAEEEYQKVLEIKPEAIAAHLGLAQVYFQNMKFDQAIPELQKVLAVSPSDPEASYFMAEILVYRHEYADAMEYLHNGLKGEPSSVPRVHALLGRVYAAQGQTAAAISELKQSLAADNDGAYHYQLYLLYKKEGNQAAATIALQKSETLRTSKLARQRALLENVR